MMGLCLLVTEGMATRKLIFLDPMLPDYIQNMTGVDRADQPTLQYNIARKSNKMCHLFSVTGEIFR